MIITFFIVMNHFFAGKIVLFVIDFCAIFVTEQRHHFPDLLKAESFFSYQWLRKTRASTGVKLSAKQAKLREVKMSPSA